MKPRTVDDELTTEPRPRLRLEASHLLAMVLGLVLGGSIAWAVTRPRPVREGVLFSVAWMESDDVGKGLSRAEQVHIPGGNGSGSGQLDMYGRLYPNYLEVEFVGPSSSRPVQIIPLSRIVDIEFGTGWIKDLK